EEGGKEERGSLPLSPSPPFPLSPAPMRSPLVLLALLLASTAARAQDTPVAPACPGALTVTRPEIEASGAVYLTDLLRLLPPLRRTTLDGFAWRVESGRGVPGGEPPPLVLVDGVPADLGFLGGADLEE